MIRRTRYKKESRIQQFVKEQIRNNIGTYILLGLIFLVSIALGVFFINSLSTTQIGELKDFLNNKFENVGKIQQSNIKQLLFENIIVFSVMWFLGLTIIGIIINYIIIIYKGFCIGYTISAITTAIGVGKTFGFVFLGMFFQNVLLIPAMFGVTVSGIRFFKEVLKSRNREDVLLGIIRHTIFSIMMMLIALVSGFIEVLLCNPLLKLI